MTTALTEEGLSVARANAQITWDDVVGRGSKDFNPDQLRDRFGRWTDGAGGGGGGGGTAVIEEPRRFDDMRSALGYLREHFPQSWKDENGKVMDAWLNTVGYKWMNLYLRKGQAAVDRKIEQSVRHYENEYSTYVRSDPDAVQRWRDHVMGEAQEFVGQVPALQRAIETAPPLDEPLVAHRGLNAKLVQDLKPGDVLTDKGFVATALSPEGTGAYKPRAKQATVEITLPAGTRGAWSAGGLQEELYGAADELVLPHDASFTVTDNDGEGHLKAVYNL